MRKKTKLKSFIQPTTNKQKHNAKERNWLVVSYFYFSLKFKFNLKLTLRVSSSSETAAAAAPSPVMLVLQPGCLLSGILTSGWTRSERTDDISSNCFLVRPEQSRRDKQVVVVEEEEEGGSLIAIAELASKSFTVTGWILVTACKIVLDFPPNTKTSPLSSLI
jgi:hypothetical protein